MYRLKIITKYNVIDLTVEDIDSPSVKEILEQPYVVEYYAEVIDDTIGGISEKEAPSFKKILKEDKYDRR